MGTRLMLVVMFALSVPQQTNRERELTADLAATTWSLGHCNTALGPLQTMYSRVLKGEIVDRGQFYEAVVRDIEAQYARQNPDETLDARTGKKSVKKK